MTLYEKFKKMDLDLSRLGLAPGDTHSGYFCAPKGARVIGWAGVDGIHCCFVEGFGEMVFTVSPMNTRGNYVKPVANTFEDFLRLLLACGGLDAVEQAWMWNRGEFDAFMETYPPNEKQRAVLDALRDGLSLIPMDDPYGYIRGVQSSFDYGRLSFSEEYDALVPDEPETQQPPERPEWRVYFEDGFSSRHHGPGKPGKEITLNKSFSWAGRGWHIPAVYLCGKGLVMDFCVEIEPDALRAFLKKWWHGGQEGRDFTPEEQEQQMAENPMALHFTPKVTVNGRQQRRSSGNGFGWTPDSCRPPEEQGQRNQQDWEAIWLMEHYGLDPELGWVFWRSSFPWATKAKPALKTLSLSLEQDRQAVPGPRFTVSGAGDTVKFTHPVTGESHTLTVTEYAPGEMDSSRLLPEDWDYPTRYTSMSYTLEPELPRNALAARDCGQGDSPRVNARRQAELAALGGADGPAAACSVGIIGGVDGPTTILLSNAKTAQLHSACSALRFEPPEQIEWRLEFYQKTAEDLEIDLPLA